MWTHHQKGEKASDEELRSYLLNFGGTSMDVLNDKNFLEYYIHITKADLQAIINQP